MTRRRLFVTTVAFALFLAAFAGVFLAVTLNRPEKPGARITAEVIAGVRPGMTYDEVVAHLGCPPGYYNTPVRVRFGPLPPHLGRSEAWIGRRAGLTVQFDTSEGGGRAISVNPFPHPHANTPSFLGVFIR